KIVAFADMRATVGLILRFLQERGGIIGNVVSWLGGIAWNLATFLVIPVLVAHDIGPWEAIQTSASLLKRTWGEQITGNWSVGGVFFLFYLLIIVVGGALGFLAGAV